MVINKMGRLKLTLLKEIYIRGLKRVSQSDMYEKGGLEKIVIFFFCKKRQTPYRSVFALFLLFQGYRSI